MTREEEALSKVLRISLLQFMSWPRYSLAPFFADTSFPLTVSQLVKYVDDKLGFERRQKLTDGTPCILVETLVEMCKTCSCSACVQGRNDASGTLLISLVYDRQYQAKSRTCDTAPYGFTSVLHRPPYDEKWLGLASITTSLAPDRANR